MRRLPFIFALICIPAALHADMLYFGTGDCPSYVALPPLADHALSWNAELQIARPARTPIRFMLINDRTDTLSMTLTPRPASDPVYGKDMMEIAWSCPSGNGSDTAAASANHLNAGKAEIFRIDTNSGATGEPEVALICGGKQIWRLAGEPAAAFLGPDAPRLDALKIEADGLRTQRMSIRYMPENTPFTSAPIAKTDIEAALDGASGCCGYWEQLDYTADSGRLLPGGRYSLAVIPEGPDLKIIYLDGAGINPGRWRAGMTKGYMRPTPVATVYRVTWYDANGEALPGDGEAQYLAPSQLTITFPRLDSSIRFVRGLKK